MQNTPVPITRREFVSSTLGLGIAAACTSGSLICASAAHAQAAGSSSSSSGNVITRTIARTSERVPAVGLGTFLTFDTVPGQERNHLGEVIRRFWEAGARVVDTSPLYGTAEITVGDFAHALGITDRLFIANKIWATGEYLLDDSHIRRSFELSQRRLWRERIDLMQCHSLVNVETVIPTLQAWKKEGRIRYIGVTHHDVLYFPALASWVERGDLDFVQLHYSMLTRDAEDRILPAAQANGTAVLVNMPFEKARLFKLVQGRALPDFAREIGMQTWAQFFLKWVIAHSAVTCVLPSTANPDHMADNMGALRGALPDKALRARMLKFVESLPGFSDLSREPWYPQKRYPGVITRARERSSPRT